ncbi:MAG: nucleotidyltransferase domain-containing protein [Prevotellaceae bacterium]|jgi:predicted nucleotidyltransferase|nr:nucleotidyltransferase domain-containing protein [Prevotellaceae bacterium]
MTLSDREMLDKIKHVLRTNAPNTKAVLYGSRARGDARPDSDWDILVIIDREQTVSSDYEQIAYPLYDLGCESDASISVSLYTENEWEKRSFTLFYKNVEAEGIVL